MITLNDFELRDGIYFPKNYGELANSKYRQQWNKEAITDHIRSAIARSSQGKENYATLTAKVANIWRLFPVNKHFDSIIDIAETMLRYYLKYKEKYDFFPSAEFYLVCTSAEKLPLENDSIDFVFSSA